MRRFNWWQAALVSLMVGVIVAWGVLAALFEYLHYDWQFVVQPLRGTSAKLLALVIAFPMAGFLPILLARERRIVSAAVSSLIAASAILVLARFVLL